MASHEAVMKLLAAAERERPEFRCVRDGALLSVLIFCGPLRS